MQSGLKECTQTEPDGSVSIKLRLVDEASINELARAMAAFAGMATTESKKQSG
jgi:hypothetical protein